MPELSALGSKGVLCRRYLASPFSVAGARVFEQRQSAVEDCFEPLGVLFRFARDEARQLIDECQRRQSMNDSRYQQVVGITRVTLRARREGCSYE